MGTFELIELYFNSKKDKKYKIEDYSINESIITIRYKRYIVLLKREKMKVSGIMIITLK